MKDKAHLINATASCNNWLHCCWRRNSLFVLALALGSGWSALAPSAQAVSPPPDGGYSNGNTAEGTDALFSLTTASQNTAVGVDALHDKTAGGFNTAIGAYALQSNTTGAFNTAIGSGALDSSLTASQNTAIGFSALLANTSGTNNTASGYLALWSNTGGTSNTGLDLMRSHPIRPEAEMLPLV